MSNKLDFRKLGHKVLEEIRITSVKRVIQAKEDPVRVANDYGYNVRNLYKWLVTYKKYSYRGLKAVKVKGRNHKLTNEQLRKLKNLIGKDPRQLKFHFGLWTIAMVAKLIKDKFNVEYKISGIHRLLHELGYSYQKPILKPIERNKKAVQAWIKEEYPKIRKEARKEKRSIYFGDESGFQSIHNKVKTWGKVGVRPIVEHTGRRFSKGVVSAITPQGKIKFMQYDGGMTKELFIKFLKRLQDSNQRKVTLIVDGLPAHKAKKVKEYIQQTEGKMKLYHLPGYSPDLNPDELVWSEAKGYVQRNLPTTKKELERSIASILYSMQKREDHIRKLFCHPKVAYINGR